VVVVVVIVVKVGGLSRLLLPVLLLPPPPSPPRGLVSTPTTPTPYPMDLPTYDGETALVIDQDDVITDD